MLLKRRKASTKKSDDATRQVVNASEEIVSLFCIWELYTIFCDWDSVNARALIVFNAIPSDKINVNLEPSLRGDLFFPYIETFNESDQYLYAKIQSELYKNRLQRKSAQNAI